MAMKSDLPAEGLQWNREREEDDGWKGHWSYGSRAF
jgi:hypothetical protein